MAVADIQRFQQILGTAKSALIILPENPTIDTIAAGLALSLALRRNDKSPLAVSVACPTPMTVEVNRLVGINEVRQDFADKNLCISFVNYPSEDVDKVSYNIDNGQFALTIAPKPGKTLPKREQIDITHQELMPDIVVVVGVNYPDGLGVFAQERKILENVNLTLLGNTPLSGWPRGVELIDASSSSISEVAQDVVSELGLPMDEDIATNLFLGIEDGTANFTSASVSASTFAKAASLLQGGARRQEAMPKMIRQTQHSQIPPVWEEPQANKGPMPL